MRVAVARLLRSYVEPRLVISSFSGFGGKIIRVYSHEVVLMNDSSCFSSDLGRNKVIEVVLMIRKTQENLSYHGE